LQKTSSEHSSQRYISEQRMEEISLCGNAQGQFLTLQFPSAFTQRRKGLTFLSLFSAILLCKNLSISFLSFLEEIKKEAKINKLKIPNKIFISYSPSELETLNIIPSFVGFSVISKGFQRFSS